VAEKVIGNTEVQNKARVGRNEYRTVLGTELIRELILNEIVIRVQARSLSAGPVIAASTAAGTKAPLNSPLARSIGAGLFTKPFV